MVVVRHVALVGLWLNVWHCRMQARAAEEVRRWRGRAVAAEEQLATALAQLGCLRAAAVGPAGGATVGGGGGSGGAGGNGLKSAAAAGDDWVQQQHGRQSGAHSPPLLVSRSGSLGGTGASAGAGAGEAGRGGAGAGDGAGGGANGETATWWGAAASAAALDAAAPLAAGGASARAEVVVVSAVSPCGSPRASGGRLVEAGEVRAGAAVAVRCVSCVRVK